MHVILSHRRHSSNAEYYKQGGVVIPGILADGMDVLAVREAVKYCKEFSGSGKGPIFLEVKTYRYHGHSMSDPGITYRDRDEVASMRQSKDCIEQVKNRIVEAGWSTVEELKEVEKQIRRYVQVDAVAAVMAVVYLSSRLHACRLRCTHSLPRLFNVPCPCCLLVPAAR